MSSPKRLVMFYSDRIQKDTPTTEAKPMPDCIQCHRTTHNAVETFERMTGPEPGDGYELVQLHVACVGAYLMDEKGAHLTYIKE